jgi:hypothetical protein
MIKSHEEGQRTDPVQRQQDWDMLSPTLARKLIGRLLQLRVIKLHNQLDGT